MTVVPLPDGRVRAAFNRDEQRSRPAAGPPEVRRFGRRLAAYSVDPPSGGTWLAANDAGLLLALLNVNPGRFGPIAAPRQSRGEIIPALLGCDSPADALEAVGRAVDYPAFAPFRLVLVGGGVAADVRWDGTRAMVTNRLVGGGPLLFTSSGLGDHLVEDVRRDLFADAFAGPPGGWAAAQDAFHRLTLPGREYLGVNMSRADARTVSYVVVVLGDDEITFTYHPDAPDRPAEPTTVRLPLEPVGVA